MKKGFYPTETKLTKEEFEYLNKIRAFCDTERNSQIVKLALGITKKDIERLSVKVIEKYIKDRKTEYVVNFTMGISLCEIRDYYKQKIGLKLNEMVGLAITILAKKMGF